jgi:hypothetical protein
MVNGTAGAQVLSANEPAPQEPQRIATNKQREEGSSERDCNQETLNHFGLFDTMR